jgi:hypothetical protein
MLTTRHTLAGLLAALAMIGAWHNAPAEDGCLDFKWDVTRERALFAGTPSAATAGKDVKSAPKIVPGRLYKIKLSSQEQVTFPVVPGKKLAASGTFGGVAALKLAAAGSYRFSIDLPLWMDVVANAMLVPAKDFEGQHACGAPHKIVEFELAGGLPLVLQMSNSSSDEVLLTVTPTPARKR